MRLHDSISGRDNLAHVTCDDTELRTVDVAKRLCAGAAPSTAWFYVRRRNKI